MTRLYLWEECMVFSNDVILFSTCHSLSFGDDWQFFASSSIWWWWGMFSSAMRKLRPGGGNPTPPQPQSPIPKSEEPHPMSVSLQKKFSKGINYNMKLLIRGDRMSGKSSLFNRLQGFPFPKDPGYVATEEISVASIQWNYKATDDVVKVEVWDVVDRGKKRPALQGLKLSSTDVPPPQPALDAEFVDVYKGAHGVVLLYDMTKSWTFDYIKRELPKIPSHLPVLILANFADQCHHRTTTKDQALGLIDEVLSGVASSRDKNSIRYAESSMRNGFGLKFLHKFLNLPFLTLQRSSLLTQIQMNDRDLLATHQELDLLADSEEASYESFSDNAAKVRRQVAESQGPPPTVDVVLGAQKPIKEEVSPILPPPPKPDSPPTATEKGATVKDLNNVDDFVPEFVGIDNFLLEEDSSQKTNSNRLAESSDDEGVNHLVAGFNEDVVIDDYDMNSEVIVRTQDESSSSEEEPPVVVVPPQREVSIAREEEELQHPSIPEEASKKHHKKKKKSRSNRKKSEEEERMALEEFLNGTPNEEGGRTSNAYEEF